MKRVSVRINRVLRWRHMEMNSILVMWEAKRCDRVWRRMQIISISALGKTEMCGMVTGQQERPN